MFYKITANTEVVNAKPRPVAECGARLLRAPVPVFSPARQHLPSPYTRSFLQTLRVMLIC